MEKKMTYATAIDKALAGEVTAEVVERLTDLKASLAKRSSKRSEKKVAEQDASKSLVVSALEAIGKAAQVTEIVAVTGLSSQKVTAMLTKLVADGVVVRTVDKKKAFYALVKTESEADGEGAEVEE